MNRTTFQKIAVAVVIGGTLTAAQAQSRPQTQMPFLHPLFSNHAVLQRDLEVPVWGWADPGTDVTVEFAGQKVTAKAGNDGKWMLKLGKMGISAEPRTMKVTGTANNLTQTVEAKDILVGDVWFCSGQSNMEMGMKLCNAQADIDAANYPTLRLLMVPHSVQYQPQQTAVMSWEACTPQVLENKGVWGGYSATAFYFGRELNQTLNIPIGLIHRPRIHWPRLSGNLPRNLRVSLDYLLCAALNHLRSLHWNGLRLLHSLRSLLTCRLHQSALLLTP